MQLDRVAVAVDFSETSVAAARWTTQYFARGAELVLVHAVFVPEPPVFLRGRFPARETLVATAHAGADRRLRELSLSLGAERIWLEIRDGEPADRIADVAGEYAVDAVVVGAHGERTGMLRRLGSTAERVARESRVPVLLATGALDSAPSKLLIAMDDASITPSVVDWSRLLAARYGAEVTGVHVVSPTVLGGLLTLAAIASGTPQPEVPGIEDLSREDAGRFVQALVANGFDAARTHAEVAYGDPAQEILAAAARRGADLIIMGRHGAGRGNRGGLGSVTAHVLRGAQCPVLVVTERAEEGAGAGAAKRDAEAAA